MFKPVDSRTKKKERKKKNYIWPCPCLTRFFGWRCPSGHFCVWVLRFCVGQIFTFEQAFGLPLCAFLESGHLLQDVLPSGATLWTMRMGFLRVVLPPSTSFLGRRCHPKGPVRKHRALCWHHRADRCHQRSDVQLLERARLQQRGDHIKQRRVLPFC